MLDDPHLKAIGFFKELEHPTEGAIRVMDVPGHWSESAPGIRRHAPRLGEHSSEVLGEIGYDEKTIASLFARGISLNG
jgi:crotonobetainyl-CoA:carnitine CoA-transferase CaiB-like acyl-CoA transferase